MFENILIPTDGSEGARRGAEHGLDIAGRYEATVHAIFVVDERIYGQTPALSSDELELEKIEDFGKEAMAEITERAERMGLEAVTHCARGLPYEEIIDYAQGHDIDLIVMGIHGTTGVTKPHIGSVTDRVIRMSNVPVLHV